MKKLSVKRCLKKICTLFFRSPYKLQIKADTEQWGTEYGGFRVVTSRIKNKSPIVLSFGAGEDISFDLAAIERCNANVYSFDPTPKSIDWIKRQNVPVSFHFYPYGLSDRDGNEHFYLPQNTDYVSGSTIKNINLMEEAIEVPMKRFKTIINEIWGGYRLYRYPQNGYRRDRICCYA